MPVPAPPLFHAAARFSPSTSLLFLRLPPCATFTTFSPSCTFLHPLSQTTISARFLSNSAAAFAQHWPSLLLRRDASFSAQGYEGITSWDEEADFYFARAGGNSTPNNSSSAHDLTKPRADKHALSRSSRDTGRIVDHRRTNMAASVSISRRDSNLSEGWAKPQDRVYEKEHGSREWRGSKDAVRQRSERGVMPKSLTPRRSQREYSPKGSARGSREEASHWSGSYVKQVVKPQRKLALNDEHEDEDSEDNQDDEGRDNRYRSSRREWERWDLRDQRREPSEVPTLDGEAIYGIGPIKAALHARRRELYTLYIQENMDLNTAGKRKAKEDISWISEKAKTMDVRTVTSSKHVLNMLVDNRPHQGFVLDASPLELVQMEKLDVPFSSGQEAVVWIALDEVKDPQNFGAILRSAYFFGVRGVVVCAKNSAPLSGVVSKASAGALEVMDLHYCRNMMKFLQGSSENGWRIVGSSVDRGSIPLNELPHGVPTILVLGNEGAGLRTNVLRSCTDVIHIPGMFSFKRSGSKQHLSPCDDNSDLEGSPLIPEGHSGGAEVNCLLGPPVVDSLNVSVAAGILLHQLLAPSSRKGE